MALVVRFSTIPIKQGGLGLVDPSSSAIPTFLLSTHKCIQYAKDGVWISKTQPNVPLPPNITDLYKNWKSSSSKTFLFFRKYLDNITDICVRPTVEDKKNFFLYNSSINTCRERIKDRFSTFTRAKVKIDLKDDSTSLSNLDDILNNKVSLAMMELSRLDPGNRLPSLIFSILLK